MRRKTKKFWVEVKTALKAFHSSGNQEFLLNAVDLLSRAGFQGEELDCALEGLTCNLEREN